MTRSDPEPRRILWEKATTTLASRDVLAYAVYCFEQQETDPLWLAPAVYLLEKQLPLAIYDAKLFALAGSLRFMIEDYTQAYFHFQKAKELDPQLALGKYWGRLCLLLGEEGKRNEGLQKTLLFDGIRLQKQGELFFRQGDFVSAKTIFSQLFWANPNDKKVQYAFGKTLFALGQYSEVLKIFPSLETSGEAFFLVAEAYIRSDSNHSVRPYLQKWIEACQHPQAHYLLALLAEKEKKWDLMEGHIFSGLEKQPEHGPLLEKIIEIGQRRGKKTDVEKYQKAYEAVCQKHHKEVFKTQQSLALIKKIEAEQKESFISALEKGFLKSALEKSKKLAPPQNWIGIALIHYFAGHPEKAQQIMQQIPFQYQTSAVHLWKAIFAMGDSTRFPVAEFDLNPAELSWLDQGFVDVIRILGYHWAGESSKVNELLLRYREQVSKHPLLLRFMRQETAFDEKKFFAQKVGDTNQASQIELVQKSIAICPTPEALHHQGIFLYRTALASQKINDWKEVYLFWRDRFEDQAYWAFWKEQSQKEEMSMDPRFQGNFLIRFKEQMIHTCLQTAIEAVSPHLSHQERRAFISLLRFSPFPLEWVQVWSEYLLTPILAPFQQKLKEIRPQLLRLQETKEIRLGYLILEQIENEGRLVLQNVQQIDPYFSCFLIQEEFAEILFQLAQFFLSEEGLSSVGGIFTLELAKKLAQNSSLIHQIKHLQGNIHA